jgi:hypothetical protein
MLRQVLRKHYQFTESPRAAWLLDLDSPLPMVRLQPLTLPCSVNQTWEPLLKRLPDSVAEIPAEV